MVQKIIIGWTLLLSATAQAYIPPSAFLVKQLASKRAKNKIVKVVSVVTLYSDSEPSGIQFREETQMDYKKRLLTSRTFNGEGEELHVLIRNFKFRKRGGEKPEHVLPKGYLGPPTNFLIFENYRSILSAALIRWGIPVQREDVLEAMETEEERRAAEKTALKRWGDKYAWVIGQPATEGSEFQPQVWVEKDHFLPIRLMGVKFDDSAQNDTEVEFFKQRFSKGFFYPDEIRVRKGGQMVLMSKLKEIDVNFKVKKEKKSAVKANATGFTPLGESADATLKDLIRQYHTYVR